MEASTMKVGELARRTGLTVRTLHHYDEIGLLSPSRRTAAGHRLYGEEEVRRLQQIASLRQIGISLEEIRDCLDRRGLTLHQVLAMQIRRLDDQIESQRRLRASLDALLMRLASAEGVSVDELTETIEGTVMFEKCYSADQFEYLAERAEEVGQERMQQVQQEWAELFRRYAEEMEKGTDPGAPEVQALARKSTSLIQEFTGGDPGILQSLTDMYRQEGGENVVGRRGMETQPGLWEYMGKAGSILRGSEES